MNLHKQLIKQGGVSGYTLIESLVASAVLMIAISAAASLSLALVTQEEISERSVRAMNYLDTAASLLQLGIAPGEVTDLLPDEPVVVSLSIKPKTLTMTGSIGATSYPMNAYDVTVVYSPNNSNAPNAAGDKKWTGGKEKTTRSHTVSVLAPNQSP